MIISKYMHFVLGHEKLFTHVSFFVHKVLPADVMLLYPIQHIIHAIEKVGERAFLSACSVPNMIWKLVTEAAHIRQMHNGHLLCEQAVCRLFWYQPMSYHWVLRQLQDRHWPNHYKDEETDQRSELANMILLCYHIAILEFTLRWSCLLQSSFPFLSQLLWPLLDLNAYGHFVCCQIVQ